MLAWFICTYFSGSVSGNSTYTSDINENQEYGFLNVVFVLDTSYSMNQTDKDNLVGAIAKNFINLSYAKYSPYVKIGFVTYNDQIESFAPLTKITDETSKEFFQKNFDSPNRIGRTDTGLAMKKGWEMLISGKDDAKSVLVLITDGEIDINSAKSERSILDSVNDLNYVTAEAQNNKVPIYTVALKNDEFEPAYLIDLSRLAQSTGAENYTAGNFENCSEIAQNILTASIPQITRPVAAPPQAAPAAKNRFSEIILIIFSLFLLLMIYCREKTAQSLKNKRKEVDLWK